MQNHMSLTVIRPKSKPEVEFQHSELRLKLIVFHKSFSS